MTVTVTIPNETPFIVQHRRDHITPGGDFTPAARLYVTPALRTSGLLTTLPPEELRDLLLILTFLTPNGWVHPTLLELAEAMSVSQAKARGRLARLTRHEWQGAPLVVALPREGGQDAFAPGRRLIEQESEQAATTAENQSTMWQKAGRDAVLAHSRARYARTRTEVEAEIAERMGWASPSFPNDEPEAASRKQVAYEKMTTLGIDKDQAIEMLSQFPLERIERQITWIGRRNAKKPGRYLMAAIEHDYEAPLGIRSQSNTTSDTAKDKSGKQDD